MMTGYGLWHGIAAKDWRLGFKVQGLAEKESDREFGMMANCKNGLGYGGEDTCFIS